MARLGPHFSLREFQCPDCKRAEVSPNLVRMLEILRTLVGGPIHITSGFRCATRNLFVGGSKNSQHMQGKAADIWAENISLLDLAKLAWACGFGGVKLYKTHVHVDVRLGKRFHEGFKEEEIDTMGMINFKSKTFWGGLVGIVGGVGLIVQGAVAEGTAVIWSGIMAIFVRDAITKIE